MPIFSFLKDQVGAPIMQIPLGQSSDGAHLPNERIRVMNLHNGKEVLKHIIDVLDDTVRGTVGPSLSTAQINGDERRVIEGYSRPSESRSENAASTFSRKISKTESSRTNCAKEARGATHGFLSSRDISTRKDATADCSVTTMIRHALLNRFRDVSLS